MKKEKKYDSRFSLLGYFLFLLPVAVILTFAVIIYSALTSAFESAVVVMLFMFLYCLTATLLLSLADVIRRKITVDKPVGEILEATEKIASGDFSVSLSPTHQINKFDRYDAVMDNINRMAAELKKSEISKTEFISNVSHEIKTPLAVIKNYAKALADDKTDKEARNKYIDVLIKTTERLSELVTNILKLNKLENQALTVEKRNLCFGELLRECVLNFEALAEKKNLEFSCDISDFNVSVEPNYAEIVFNNLISNAVKFSFENGKIDIGLKRSGFDAVFTVRDYGIGMTPDVGAHVFEKFYQGDTSHKEEGNGLGLAIVKKVINVIGGEISVKSKVNEGSEFSVVFKGVIGE